MGKHRKQQASRPASAGKYGLMGLSVVGGTVMVDGLAATFGSAPAAHADPAPHVPAVQPAVGKPASQATNNPQTKTLASRGVHTHSADARKTAALSDQVNTNVKKFVQAHSSKVSRVQGAPRVAARPTVSGNSMVVSMLSGNQNVSENLQTKFITGATKDLSSRGGSSIAKSVAVRAALTRLGSPYVWGATGPSAFDCSGLMVWSYHQAGITLPRDTWGQMTYGTPVTAVSALTPGDLVIYDGGTHVGMYIGNGMVVHAPSTGDHVRVVPVRSMSIFAMRHV